VNLSEFVQEWNGKLISVDGALGPDPYGAQCVCVVNEWCKEIGVEAFAGNAADFEFDSHPDCEWIGNTSANYPLPGDIVVWARSPSLPYGHVAIAEAGATINGFSAFTQNWPYGSACHSQAYTYAGVAGWLHPNVLTPPAPAEWESQVKWGRFGGTISAQPSANVRNAPGTQGTEVLYVLGHGSSVGFDGYVHWGPGIPDAITGQPDDRWFHVVSDNREGWIASAMVNGNPSF